MLILTDFIAAGTERAVYRHPGHPGRVVKIPLKGSHIDRNSVELAFAQAVDMSKFRSLPKFFGPVETSLGAGLEFELVADEAGQPAPSVFKAVHSGMVTADQVTILFHQFYRQAISAGLIVYDHSPGNFLFRTGDLVLVDGYGPREWHLRNWFRARFPIFSRKKTKQAYKATLREWKDWSDGVLDPPPAQTSTAPQI